MSEVPRFDTVTKAESTPDTPQPYAELGMKDDEYARVREILGRRPTSAEMILKRLNKITLKTLIL